MIIAANTSKAYQRGQRPFYYRHALGLLGDAITPQSQLDQAAQYQAALSAAGQDLQTLANAAAQNAQTYALIGQQLQQAQANFTALTQKLASLVGFWQTLAASVLPGADIYQAYEVSQLGSQMAQLEQQIQQMQQQISAAATSSETAAIAQGTATTYGDIAANAAAAGDGPTAAQYSAMAATAQGTALAAQQTAQAAVTPPPADPWTEIVAWLESNWLLVAVGVGVIVVLPPLIKKL